MQQQQLDLFNTNDERPLPLIVADKWGFDLAYIERDDDGTLLYSARDWFMGMGGTQTRYSEAISSDWFRSTEAVDIEVKRQRRAPEMLPFVTDKGLYIIAQNMRSMNKRPQIAEIKDYLAAAGAFQDKQRLDPSIAIDAGIEAYRAQGKPSGWIEARVNGKVNRKSLTATLTTICPELNIGEATNNVYTGVFARDAATLKAQMGLKKSARLRDNMHHIGLHMLGIVEGTLDELFKERDEVPQDEALATIISISRMFGRQADEIQQVLGIDIATGRPLLGDGQ